MHNVVRFAGNGKCEINTQLYLFPRHLGKIRPLVSARAPFSGLLTSSFQITSGLGSCIGELGQSCDGSPRDPRDSRQQGVRLKLLGGPRLPNLPHLPAPITLLDRPNSQEPCVSWRFNWQVGQDPPARVWTLAHLSPHSTNSPLLLISSSGPLPSLTLFPQVKFDQNNSHYRPGVNMQSKTGASVGEKGSGGSQSLSASYGGRKGARYDRRHLWQETSLGHLPGLKLARPIFWRGGGRVGFPLRNHGQRALPRLEGCSMPFHARWPPDC